MPDDDPVLYEERDGVAIVTLSRPEKLNTLNEAVIEGLARAVDRAAESEAVSAVVLRGAGSTFTAGYDLDFNARTEDSPSFRSHNYGAPRVEQREGAWDPVRDFHMMGHNVRRFMRIWDCPKPVIGELRGWAIGGGTDLLLCCDLIFMGEQAHIGYAPSRIFGTPTTMLWVYRVSLEHAKRRGKMFLRQQKWHGRRGMGHPKDEDGRGLPLLVEMPVPVGIRVPTAMKVNVGSDETACW